MTQDVQRVGIFVEDDFPLISYASVLCALKTSNEAADEQRFKWRTVSSAAASIKSDGGLITESEPPYIDGRIQYGFGADQILVILSNVRDPTKRKFVTSWIRGSISRGAKILAVGGGTKLLCEAGIMNGKRCAVHWSEFGAAVEKYPRVVISRAFFELDGAILTCAGELATFDSVMRLISPNLPSKIVDAVSARCFQALPKGKVERQSLPDQIRLERLNSPLLRVFDQMEDNIVEPLSMTEICRSARISRRQAERLFEQQLGTSPKRFYLRLRLERARDLLRHTRILVSDVAAATGFVSHAHFTKAFKSTFGLLPVAVRRSPTEDLNAEKRIYDESQCPPGNDNVALSGSDRVKTSDY